ncbi:uncharacterized protein [Drosophila virilis]|uniref:Uncharacterized protein, isoform B n=1 Tax=Drosophila virilis TaxID=7244 RepID=A0A0Q9WB51_DROVI|nr:uncharacterized protein LOC6627476 isoform X3 [Drosophila virilis]KRF81542.1 uncharacterized protein Dvir_GJ17384, isoform B [Drosophila virilis]
MDAARTYERYLSARIRVERLDWLLSRGRGLLAQRINRHGRMPAGGRFTPSVGSLSLSCVRIPISKKQSDRCVCDDVKPTTSQKQIKRKDTYASKEYITVSKVQSDRCVCDEPTCAEKGHEKVKVVGKERKKKSERKAKCKCTCKRPVIVVPSKWKYEASPQGKKDNSKMRFKCCLSRDKKKTKTCRSTQKVQPVNCPCQEKLVGAPSKESLRSDRHHSRESRVGSEPVQCTTKCTECEKIPNITIELCLLKKKLEEQIAQEAEQKQQLNVMNNQLKQLCSTVCTLNEKCKGLESEKGKLTKCVCIKKSSAKLICNRNDSTLERKVSSQCQFCKDKKLPVLSSMQYALFKMMGKRCFQDIALTILLRADNVYHVNVRDLETGCVLGCLLVTDAGIKEANTLGIFQEILTFCVIDVRNTINNKEAVFGGINFELVRDHRLTGGNTSSPKTQPEACEVEQCDSPVELCEESPKEQQSSIFCLTDDFKAAYNNSKTFSVSSSPKTSEPQVEAKSNNKIPLC